MLVHKMVYFWAKALLGLALGPSIHALHSSRAGSWWPVIGCWGLAVLMWTAGEA